MQELTATNAFLIVVYALVACFWYTIVPNHTMQLATYKLPDQFHY